MAHQPPLPLKAPGLRDGPSRPGRCGAALGFGLGPNLVLPGGGRWQEEVTRKAQQPPSQADVSALGGLRVWGIFSPKGVWEKDASSPKGSVPFL